MGLKIGIALAVVLVAVVVVVMIVALGGGNDVAEATLPEALLREVTVEMPPSDVVAGAAGEAGDAAADCAAAVALVQQHAEEVARCWMQRQDLLDGEPVGAFHREHFEAIRARVAAAGRKRDMQYLLAEGPDVLSVHYFDHPWLEKLALRKRDEQGLVAGQVLPKPTLFKALDLLGCYYRGGGDLAEAARAYEALFLLGWHMTHERSVAGMVHLGLRTQSYALRHLHELRAERGDTAAAAAAGAYREALRPLAEQYETKYIDIWLRIANRKKGGAQPGDIFSVIDHDADRAWRVQCILMLGVLRFTHAKEAFAGVQKEVQRRIEQAAREGSTLEQRAARGARQFTEEQWKLLRL